MTFVRILSTASALALVPGSALADVSAQDVWADWKDLLESYGAVVSTSSKDQSGDTLNVTGLAAEFTIEEGQMSMQFGEVTFAEQGDGSVAITMAETMPFVMNVKGPDGEEANIGFTFSQPGGRMVASGDDDKMRYEFDYPTFSLTDFTIEGSEIPDDLPFVFEMAASNMTGFMEISGDDIRDFTSESSVGQISMDMAFDDPNEGSGKFNFSMTDLTQAVKGTIANLKLDMSAAEMIEAGMTQVGTGSYGPSTFEMAVDGPDGAFDVAGAAEGGTIDMTFDENGINYGGITNAITLTVSADAMPFPPLSFAMEKSEGRIIMPMMPNPDEEQAFGLVTTLEGLKVDDMLWSMVDPTGQLPRDPATLVIDLGGSAIVTEDFTDPAYAENMDVAAPGTLESLTVNRVQLTVAGAELTGDGDFAFNNDLGMPMPSGTANVMLTGGNTLLDTLVGMGLVPEDQAMGARMMLGLFARPGDGPDTLVSTIEVNEDGSILANGQRIK